MKIKIKTVGKQEEDFLLTVKPSTTIAEVKKCVELIQDIPTEEQSLIFEDSLLKDKNTISFYDIQDEAQLYLVVETTIVNVILLREPKVILKVEPTLLVSDFKRVIQSKTSIPPRDQILFFEGEGFKDQKSLQHHGIKDGSVVSIVVRQRGS